MWESAVLGQAHLAGQSREEASQAITLMVNQLLRLAGAVPWWEQDAAAATAECIRYTAFDSDVPSRPAQLAWPTVFTRNDRPQSPALQAFLVERRAAERAWLDAWNTWHTARPLT